MPDLFLEFLPVSLRRSGELTPAVGLVVGAFVPRVAGMPTDVLEVHLLPCLGALLEEGVEVADDAAVADFLAARRTPAIAFPLREPFLDA